MSVRAINWAMEQKNLRPAEKLVLVCLADRHNKDTGACFPSQATLAEDACVSRSSLNDQLDLLEAMGFFTREAVIDPETKRQKATQYHLNIGHSVSEIQTREIRKAVSENRKKPCPKNDESRVQISDTNQRNITNKINHGGGVREREALTSFEAELSQLVGPDLLTAEGKIEADKWLSLVEPEIVLQSISEQKAKAATRIRSLKYFTPAIQRLAAIMGEELAPTDPPAPKPQKQREPRPDPMMRALAQLQAEGRLPQ